MRKFLVLMLILLIGGAVTAGCAKMFQADEKKHSNVEYVENSPLSQNQEDKVKTFDKKLKEMDTKEEAKEILTGFMDSVSGSFKDSGSLKMLSVEEKEKLNTALDKLAEREMASRGKGLKLLSENPEDALISPEKIAGTIGSISEKPVDKEQMKEGIKETQKEIRELVPNISASGDENMSPIEAMMVTYAIYAAGTVQSSAEAIKVDLPKEKALKFVEKISE